MSVCHYIYILKQFKYSYYVWANYSDAKKICDLVGSYDISVREHSYMMSDFWVGR